MASDDPPLALRLVPHAVVAGLGYTLFVVAGLPDALTTRYGVSLSAFGLLTSLPLGAFVVAQPLAGRLADGHPTVRLLLGIALAHAGFTLVLDLAPGFESLLALRFAWGLVAGLGLSVGATHIARLSTGTNGTLSQGLYGGTLTLGGAVGFLVGPLVASAPVGLHAPGALLAVPAAVVCWRHREGRWTTPVATSTTSSPRALAVAANPTVALAALVYVATLGSYVTLSTFVTSFFAERGVVGPLNALVLVGATVGRVAGGAAGFRVRDATLVGGATLAATVGFGGLALGSDGVVALVLPVLVMLAVSVPFGATYNLAAGATEAEGTALAIVVAAGNVAALLLPPVSGALREALGSYRAPFALLAVLNAVAVASAVALARREVHP